MLNMSFFFQNENPVSLKGTYSQENENRFQLYCRKQKNNLKGLNFWENRVFFIPLIFLWIYAMQNLCNLEIAIYM